MVPVCIPSTRVQQSIFYLLEAVVRKVLEAKDVENASLSDTPLAGTGILVCSAAGSQQGVGPAYHPAEQPPVQCLGGGIAVVFGLRAHKVWETTGERMDTKKNSLLVAWGQRMGENFEAEVGLLELRGLLALGQTWFRV